MKSLPVPSTASFVHSTMDFGNIQLLALEVGPPNPKAGKYRMAVRFYGREFTEEMQEHAKQRLLKWYWRKLGAV